MNARNDLLTSYCIKICCEDKLLNLLLILLRVFKVASCQKPHGEILSLIESDNVPLIVEICQQFYYGVFYC